MSEIAIQDCTVDRIVEWMDNLPQDLLHAGHGYWILYFVDPKGAFKFVGKWGAAFYQTDSRREARFLGGKALECRQEGNFSVQWHHHGEAKKDWLFWVGSEPSTDSGGTLSSGELCPDCKGSKQYVGLYSMTPCYTCQGGGPS